MAFKKCASCNTVLGINKFGCNKARKDGLQPYCILCMRKARKKNSTKERSKEKARARQKKYRERLKKEKDEKNTSVKVRTDSITKSKMLRNPLKQKKHKITLNPQPLKQSKG